MYAKAFIQGNRLGQVMLGGDFYVGVSIGKLVAEVRVPSNSLNVQLHLGWFRGLDWRHYSLSLGWLHLTLGSIVHITDDDLDIDDDFGVLAVGP